MHTSLRSPDHCFINHIIKENHFPIDPKEPKTSRDTGAELAYFPLPDSSCHLQSVYLCQTQFCVRCT